MVIEPKHVDKECVEFLVILPSGAQFDDPAIIQRVSEALHDEFPGSVFTVADGERGENFIVYPILGAADSDTQMALMPAEGAIAAISEFLEANFAGIPTPGMH